MANLTVPVVIRMSVGMHERLREAAAEEDRSVAWVVRLAVSEYLTDRHTQMPPTSPSCGPNPKSSCHQIDGDA